MDSLAYWILGLIFSIPQILLLVFLNFNHLFKYFDLWDAEICYSEIWWGTKQSDEQATI